VVMNRRAAGRVAERELREVRFMTMNFQGPR
jgi:hypothetical protein